MRRRRLELLGIEKGEVESGEGGRWFAGAKTARHSVVYMWRGARMEDMALMSWRFGSVAATGS